MCRVIRGPSAASPLLGIILRHFQFVRRHLCGESRGWGPMEEPQAGPQLSILNSQIFFRRRHLCGVSRWWIRSRLKAEGSGLRTFAQWPDMRHPRRSRWISIQLSNLSSAFSPGTFIHYPLLYSWRRKGRKKSLRFPEALNPWNRERREDFFI